MKRKIFAMVMAASMLAGTGTTILAADAQAHSVHGKTGVAAVENPASGVITNGTINDEGVVEGSTSSRGNTEFFLQIDKDASSDTGKKTDEEALVTGDMTYLVDYELQTRSSLSVTVPLYVCMYAYGGDGRVVVPEDYHMENDSTKSVTSRITAIYPCYEVQTIHTAEVYNAVKENLAEDSPVKVFNAEGGYSYYDISDGENTSYYVVNTTYCFKDGDKVYYKDTANKIAAVGESVEVTEDGSDESSTYVVGSPYPEADQESSGQDVRVASVNAAPNEWDLVSALDEDGQIRDLKAHEFTMTINQMDLSKAVKTEAAPEDILGKEWKISADSSLSLPISASIAGNSVNEDSHVSALKVTYTIVPA